MRTLPPRNMISTQRESSQRPVLFRSARRSGASLRRRRSVRRPRRRLGCSRRAASAPMRSALAGLAGGAPLWTPSLWPLLMLLPLLLLLLPPVVKMTKRSQHPPPLRRRRLLQPLSSTSKTAAQPSSAPKRRARLERQQHQLPIPSSLTPASVPASRNSPLCSFVMAILHCPSPTASGGRS